MLGAVIDLCVSNQACQAGRKRLQAALDQVTRGELPASVVREVTDDPIELAIEMFRSYRSPDVPSSRPVELSYVDGEIAHWLVCRA